MSQAFSAAFLFVRDNTFAAFYHGVPPPQVCLWCGRCEDAALIHGPGLPPSVPGHSATCILFRAEDIILIHAKIQSGEKLVPWAALLKDKD